MKILKIIVLIILIALPIRFFMVGKKSQKMIPQLGLTNNMLKQCPSSPNCVSSFATPTDQEHYLAPLNLVKNPISDIVKAAKGLKLNIVKNEDNYLQLNYKTTIFGFVDDIEFLYLDSEQKLHYRSASRVGHSDLGKNRERLLAIIKLLK